MLVATTTSAQSLCARIADRLALAVGPHRYNMWFGRSARFDYREADRRLLVIAPNRFVADWIGRNFQRELQSAVDHEAGEGVSLDLCVDPTGFTPEARALVPVARTSEAGTPPRPQQRVAGGTSEPSLPPLRYSLDDFIVGPSNELAFAAANRLADEHDSAVNPLFIHGGCGLGKTHLLQGIVKRTLEQRPAARVLYATGEQFTNEFLLAIRSGKIEQFRRKIRRLDLLAVDDVHFIANKQATQQEFLHCFDSIELAGARVVLASDCHPKLIRQFSEALVSRCVRGMVVQVHEPDTATRVKIVRALAQKRGLSMIETVVAAVAGRCTGSVREIEGTLTKLQALASLALAGGAEGNTGSVTAIGHGLVHRLGEADAATPSKPVGFEQIVAAVGERFHTTRAQISNGDRKRPTVLARSLVVHLARRLTPMSYPEIAAALGRQSHSTVVCADQRVKKQVAGNQKVLVPADSGDGVADPTATRELALADLIDDLTQAVHRG